MANLDNVTVPITVEFEPVLDTTLDIVRNKQLEEFEQRFGRFGDREVRNLALTTEVRDTGQPDAVFAVGGHASVFNSPSLDLGGFTERIDPGAFSEVLSTNPDVFFLWDHDTRYVLARTTNKSLFLNQDERGLAYYAKVAPVSYADDLRTLLEGGYLDQASFAFTVDSDTWEIHVDESGEERVTRTIHKVGRLYDVTVCAMGAYPATDTGIVRSYVHDYATSRIASTEIVEERVNSTDENEIIAQDEPAGDELVAPDEPVGSTRNLDVAKAKARAKQRKLNLNQ